MLSAPFPKMFPGRRQKRRVTPFVTEVLMYWSHSNFMVRVSDFTPGDQIDLVFLKCKCNFLYNSKMQKSMILEMFSSNSQVSLRACLFRLGKKNHFEINQYSMICFFFKSSNKTGPPRRMWGLHFASQKKFRNYLCLIFKS